MGSGGSKIRVRDRAWSGMRQSQRQIQQVSGYRFKCQAHAAESGWQGCHFRRELKKMCHP